MKKKAIRYWKISPGEEGFLWREQKLNECIAIGWSGIGNAKDKDIDALCKENHLSSSAANQLKDFVNNIQVGDRVVASASGKGVYAVGTVFGEYEFKPELEYKHCRRMRWETTFWHPVGIDSLELPKPLYNKFHGLSSLTIRRLEEDEWDEFCERLNNVSTPFRNLGMWAGLIQAPEYENEVMILFSHMLQHFRMRIIQFATRFPDAIVERKAHNKWEKLNVEFELYSSGFRSHLPDKEQKCDLIVCWEDDDWGRDNDQKDQYKNGRIIELKKHLEDIL